VYKFQSNLKFSKDGSLDELIALDRYVTNTTDPTCMGEDDVVVFIADKLKGTRLVGTIDCVNEVGNFTIVARNGETFYDVDSELVTKPLETEPQDLWARWAFGASSVENDNNKWENEFRWLFDGFKYSPGGRIQLGLGQEYLGLPKAPLTLTNCFVLEPPYGVQEKESFYKSGKFATVSPELHPNALSQWNNVIDTVLTEMHISRRGGGVGINISNINTVSGMGEGNVDVTLYLHTNHRDHEELQNMNLLGKFDGVKLANNDREISTAGYQIEVEDSIEGNIEALRQMIHAIYAGLSVEIDFTGLRHRNAIVKGVNGRSSGAVAWMELFAVCARLTKQETIDAVDFAEIFSFVINLIQQGGSRRGALMLVCNDNHPCVEKFITRKRTAGFLHGANISVGISEQFMEDVKRYQMYGDEDGFYGQGRFAESKNANNLWQLIIKSAWESAEPGVIWLERYNNMSNSWYYAPIVATNPCGEQGLGKNGACNLGHHVLPTYVKGDWAKGNGYVDWDSLAKAVRLGTRFQDNMIDYGMFPTEETKQQQLLERRIGMGTMGLGTMLIMLGLRYGSPEAEKFINKLYSFIAYHAYDESINLSGEKGPFPAFEYEKFVQSGFMRELLCHFPELDARLKKHGIRNVTILTQAPTGSTGTMLDQMPDFECSTGIEPYFAFSYWRAGRLGTYEQEVGLVKKYREANGLSTTDKLPDYFVTAQDLRPEDHARVQGAIQKWVDSSISKTCNAPNEYTVEDTDQLYMLAYDVGCKGMTIYRSGSRQAQVLATSKEDAKLESHIEAEKLEEILNNKVEFKLNSPYVPSQEGIIMKNDFKKRPPRLFGFTEKVRVQIGDKSSKVYITMNVDGDTHLPVEVFIQANDTDLKPTAEALGRMTTQFLRFGDTKDNVEQAIKHLRKGQIYGSLPWWVAHLLEGIVYGKIEFPGVKAPKKGVFQTCADCGAEAYDKANCICHSCGSSKCN
jgi:ribonucleoside-diphosphate reductase alpha chain